MLVFFLVLSASTYAHDAKQSKSYFRACIRRNNPVLPDAGKYDWNLATHMNLYECSSFFFQRRFMSRSKVSLIFGCVLGETILYCPMPENKTEILLRHKNLFWLLFLSISFTAECTGWSVEPRFWRCQELRIGNEPHDISWVSQSMSVGGLNQLASFSLGLHS